MSEEYIYIIEGFWREDGGYTEPFCYPHKTLKGARGHLKDIIKNDIKERPNELREIEDDHYLSYPEFGEDRFELDIIKCEIGE